MSDITNIHLLLVVHNSTFIQKFVVLQRVCHHARRLNKVNKIKSNDVKKEKKNSIKDKMDKK